MENWILNIWNSATGNALKIGGDSDEQFKPMDDAMHLYYGHLRPYLRRGDSGRIFAPIYLDANGTSTLGAVFLLKDRVLVAHSHSFSHLDTVYVMGFNVSDVVKVEAFSRPPWDGADPLEAGRVTLNSGYVCDLIFFCPPSRRGLAETTLATIGRWNWITANWND